MALLLLLAGCDGPARTDSAGWFLVEKGTYQVLYSPDGKIDRLLYDANGDRKADMIALFGPDGKPASSQTDRDLDGAVDRWEYLDPDGRLAKLGHARRQPGTPDEWEVFDAAAEVSRREFDEDGDGTLDRTEYVSKGLVFLEELDSDHDGTPDRRIFRGPGGEVSGIEVGKDGIWQRVNAAGRGADVGSGPSKEASQ